MLRDYYKAEYKKALKDKVEQQRKAMQKQQQKLKEQAKISQQNEVMSLIIPSIHQLSLDLVIKLIKKTNATRFILTTFRHRPMSSSGNEF